jgi:hypothetical protein
MQAKLSVISPTGSETAWQPSSSLHQNPANINGSSSQMNQLQSAGNSSLSGNTYQDNTFAQSNSPNLPRTASSLPLIGLIGLLSIGAALVLKAVLTS